MIFAFIIFWMTLPLLAAIDSLATNSIGTFTLLLVFTGGGILVVYQAVLSILLKISNKNTGEIGAKIRTFGTGFVAVFAPLFIYGLLFGFPTDTDVPIRIDGPDLTSQEIVAWHHAASLHYAIMTILVIVFAYFVGQAFAKRKITTPSNLALANYIWFGVTVLLILSRILVPKP
jgi:hypothetical protein